MTRPIARSPGAARRTAGVLRLLAAAAVLAAVTTQIVDQVLNDEFTPSRYFAYFTIQTSLADAVVLVAGGVVALRHASDTALLTTVRMAIAVYAVVTGSVYAVLLRGIPQEGFVGVPWPNEVIHVAVPIAIAVDWLVVPGSRRLPWTAILVAVAYPLAWAAVTLLRGAATGWFPYPFLQPDGPGGWGGVALYVLGIAVLVLALAVVAIARTRTRRRAHEG